MKSGLERQRLIRNQTTWLKMADNLMQLFWDVSSSDEEEKIESASKIIKTLSDSEIESYSDSNELQYCLQRLLKGLASNRKGVRHGYFITLTELLKVFSIPLSDVFKLIKNHLEHVGNAKAQEERGIYFGRIFAYLALIESGRLTDPVDIERVTKSIMRVHNKKSFLQEFCATSIGRLMERLTNQIIYGHVLPPLGLDCGWEKCTPGKLYLLLTLLERCSNDNEKLSEFLSLNWNCSDLVSQDSLPALSNVLMASSHSHPKIHLVWPLIINKLRGGPLWRSFWNTVVNDSLLVSSHERKYLGYKLIEESVLPSLKLSEVNIVFSQRLIQQLETNGGAKHHLLHDATKHFLGEFPSIVINGSTETGVALALGLQIVRFQSGKVFKEPLKQLMSNVSVEDIIRYIDYLVNEVVLDITGVNKHQWIQHELSRLFRVLETSLKRRRGWLITLAQFLFLQSSFIVLKPNPELNISDVFGPISVTDRVKYNERLTQVMSYLGDLKCVRGESLDQENISCDLWPVALVTHIEKMLKHKDHIQPVCEINLEVWDKAIEVVQELKEKNEPRDHVDCAFMYLLSVCLLDLVRNGEKMVDIIEEVLMCYQKRAAQLHKTPRRRKSVAPPSPSWLPVLMDILLGLLSNHDQFWRNISERVFLWLKVSLTYEAVQVIVKAIEPQKIEEVMQRDGEDEHESELGSDNNEEGGEEGSDGEMSEGSESEEDELGDGAFNDIGAEFRADVRNALGNLAAVDSDQESIMSLNEEEMDVLDGALSAVFQKQKDKVAAKKQNKADKIAVMHFKMRALEFVELYIRHQNTNPLMFEFMSPLLALVIKYNSHKTFSPLSERSRNLLDKLCRVKSYPKEGVDANELHVMLKDMITKKLYSVQRSSPVITQCVMFLLRVLKGINKPPAISPRATRSTRKRKNLEKKEETSSEKQFGALAVEDVIEWCSKSLKDMITDKNCSVQANFFTILSERQPEIAWRLMPVLVPSLKNTGNHYRKIQGYNVLRALLASNRSLSVESMVLLFQPACTDLVETMSHELMSLSVSDCKISHYMSIIEAFCDTVTIAQSMDTCDDLVDSNLVSKVTEHLASFNDHKVSTAISFMSAEEESRPVVRKSKKPKRT